MKKWLTYFALVVIAVVCLFVTLSGWRRNKNGVSSVYYKTLGIATASRKLNTGSKKELSRLSLPFRNLTYSYDVLVTKPWLNDIDSFLSQLPTNDVILLACNHDFLRVLMNWLSTYRKTTQSSLKEILILSLDNNIHKILSLKGFNTVLIPNDDLFLPSTKLLSRFSHIWIKRCTIARLLNHYGYNIVIIDLDAIVLKDIVSLMKDTSSDIIGSQGIYPFVLRRKWGFTLCMGVVMFMSTPRTG